MPSARTIDVVIGLAFVFSITAALASVLTELIARALGLRGAALLRSIRDLVDADGAGATLLSQINDDYVSIKAYVTANRTNPGQPPPASTTVGAILGGPILSNQGMTNRLTTRAGLALAPAKGNPTTSTKGTTLVTKQDRLRRHSRSLPAYIPARSFTAAVIDLLVPDDAQATTLTDLRSGINALPPSTLQTSLQAMLKSADTDIDTFRTTVEHWYDDHMARVSGWYKRRVAKITLIAGAVLVILININALTIARTLYTDNDLRSTIAVVAGKATNCPPDASQQSCLQSLHQQLTDAADTGLPLGWATVPACINPNHPCSWLDRRGLTDPRGGSVIHLLVVLLGFALTITALLPGARFWFDLLSRLGSLRNTGPKPTSS